ncbi:MAG: hypothetical protein OEZ33_08645 [Gammaproteobacteria bacterium]|nr:hypothetical protein [Gammaproteobacteria bacterium]MDH5778266.1 hypothetical protein [Gammaproteobacteria bacterium]
MSAAEQDIPNVQKIAAVLWPSFLTAGVATILFFTAFDPQLIMAVSGYGEISRMAGYSIGFFIFWLLTSSSCALTCYFRKPCDDIGKKS